jgi:tetratricopeptide (TPR) repeat protein
MGRMVTQTVTASGEGAIAVGIEGDDNTVTIALGGAKLALSKLHQLRAKPDNTSELLRTDLRATAFVGRQEQCALLREWRASAPKIGVLCFTGGAGAGKTRLAIEACEAAEAEGWIAGFAPSEELARFQATQNLVHWVPPQDALIVVDYAATSLDVLKAWFACLAPGRNRQDGRKLRILLLERQADAETGWWHELNRRESNDRAGPGDLLGARALYALPPLGAVADRRALLAETMRLAAPLLDPPGQVLSPPAPGEDAWFDARLRDDGIGNEPLYLMMAGVFAARHGARAALALDRLELAGEMAEIETARLRKFAGARGFVDNGAFLMHLVACVTLQNGCPPSALPELVEDEGKALGFQAPFDPRGVARQICDYLPSAKRAVEPIRPDLIGESFLLPVIGDRFLTEAQQQDIVLRAYCRAGSGVVDTLIRCVRDFAAGRADDQAVQWLRAIVEVCDELGELLRIHDFLPLNTLALREFALDLAQRIVAVLRNLDDQAGELAGPVLANALNTLAVRLSDLGRREAALAAGEEAVSLYRGLAAARRDAFTPYLAMSLNTLANRLSDLGQREAALAAAEEAVSLYRGLAAARPDAFTPDLAVSLNNLANRLSDLGRREAALAAAEEAVSLYRGLAAARPDAFTPNLATSLNNLANILGDLGRRDAALAVAEEAVSLYRGLAAARPDAFTPNLAGSLNNLASVLSAFGRCEAALAAAEEAVSLRRGLAAARPDAFTPDLAGSLNNLANSLSDLGRREAALAAGEEAVSLYRGLAAARPDAFTPNLAMSLAVLANMLEGIGRAADAIPRNEEAVRLLSPYFLQYPAAHAGLMQACVKEYLRRCELVGCEPDAALLGRLAAGFAALQKKA